MPAMATPELRKPPPALARIAETAERRFGKPLDEIIKIGFASGDPNQLELARKLSALIEGAPLIGPGLMRVVVGVGGWIVGETRLG